MGRGEELAVVVVVLFLCLFSLFSSVRAFVRHFFVRVLEADFE